MKKNEKPVHFRNDQLAEEKLPFPIVFYPAHYGTFICFKERKKKDLFYCTCFAEAIENYVIYNLKNPYRSCNTDPTRNFILDSFDFPKKAVIELMNKGVSQDMTILNHLNFADKICHECNQAVPSYRYCDEMYGTVFVQTYGWYINKKFWEYGIYPGGLSYLFDKCPQAIIDMYDDNYSELIEKQKHFINIENYFEANLIAEQMKKSSKKVRKFIGNEVRIKFGHKKIGEAWTSETILYYIIKKLFPNKSIKRHYRPNFLDKLELDIFVKDYNLGIEFQGIQHFKAVKHWGGVEAFEKLKERDRKKEKLCKKQGVKLLYFYYYDNLSEEYIKSQLIKFIGNNFNQEID